MIKNDNPGSKILVVDDSPTNISMLFEMLSRNSYKVFIASSGTDGIEKAQLIKPDLILLDVMMPDMDGFTVCSILKKNENLCDIPIVFMTALDDPQKKVAGFDAGASDYITKPFQIKEVLTRVDHHISLHKLKQALVNANLVLEARVAERTHQLLMAKEKAEESDKLKTEFLALMSHEIRTPLNAILSFSSLIKMQLEEIMDEDLAESLKIIEKGGRRLVRTFDLIMNMSRIKSGTYDFEPEEIDFQEIVLAKSIMPYSKVAKAKGLGYKIVLLTDDFEIECDPDMIKIVFENIIDNAITFTKEGDIKIFISRDEDDNLRIIVSDTGIGIDPAFMQKLYEPFAQQDQSFSRSYEGNGLGLALSKQYLDLHNAKIFFDSEIDKGTSVSIFLKRKL